MKIKTDKEILDGLENVFDDIKSGAISFEEGKRIMIADLRQEQQKLKDLLDQIEKKDDKG